MVGVEIPTERIHRQGHEPPMPDPNVTDPALPRIHEGWDHLQHQRPLAAWASWRRALRLVPEHPAALKALEVLANAGDLPLAARAEYRFLTPLGASRRQRWDARFRGQDLGDLAVAAEAFGSLGDDPTDGRALYNQGLCLAWLGQNPAAVAALDRAVQAMAADEPSIAVEAWTLAEVLRQGGGAESIADDLNYSVTLAWTPGEDPAGFLDQRADVRPVPNPVDPSTGQPRLSEAKIYEWLDASGGEFDRVRATVIRSARTLRLSGTDPILLEDARSEVSRLAGGRIASSRVEATPLPLAFLDAAIWAIRLPAEADEDERARRNRSAVERYYEGGWIRRPRHGLDGLSPIEAGRLASGGDPVARARLAAVVRLREQLGARPTTALLYQGYPFDRLRRRLGLEPTDPEAIDPADPTAMGAGELDRLDPGSMDDHALADAYESAAAIGDDARTSRFAEALIARDRGAMARLDLSALFATLVRQALALGDADLALRRVDEAQAIDRDLRAGADHRKYETWRAEILARAGRPDASALVYRQLLESSPTDAALALDAAETLLDNGFEDQARELARLAAEVARETGDDQVAERAETLA